MIDGNLRSEILARVMRGISLNRRPGFHFLGNFLDFKVDGNLGVLEQGPHCSDENGEVDLASFSLFFDVSMVYLVRKVVSHHDRLATLSISATFTGRPRRGPVVARSELIGLLEGVTRPQAQVRTEIEGASGIIGHALASIAVIKGQVTAPDSAPEKYTLLRRDELDGTECDILSRAETALDRVGQESGSFSDRFYDVRTSVDPTGAKSTIQNGPHITNRIGNLQGGIQIGLAAKTAGAALGNDWKLTGANVSYLRAGGGKEFEVVSRFVHKGSTTATLATIITDDMRRPILYATTNHSSCA